MGTIGATFILIGVGLLYMMTGTLNMADLAERLPSGTSRDYGKPFAEVFKAVKGDFYAIDPLLFGPARVIVSALESGRSFHQGALDEATIDRSFGAGAV